MRALPLCLLALLLAGCSATQTQPSSTNKPIFSDPKPAKPKPAAPHVAAPAKLYSSAEELVAHPFRDLGTVTGESCQATAQDAAPSLAAARKKMQVRAAGLKANAVLLHKCEVVSNVAGCYQQAVCQGSALDVTFK
ncbi:Rcs stress response system protein RcsF [Nissabacter sp. SGAir0207]|uniref:Rcs stress response system protein RcsF n=1 Tax=Nissabacter sp. SGAir0207 TaxID=2126321 RepID=UPI0010CD17B3|nr:Rcs stress response system protein RcsF [Nissabacter sp. SGAir0207]QCR35214.1 Rcs stress response system protein RcsF [Nissabacter sp. SGAir0207]